MKKVIHVIPHSHWDREWYLPFEKHRSYLLNLINDCMELFEKDPDYTCFFLDGQTIVLDDYLEIYPEKRNLLIRYLKEGRFIVGPWYILQDEFLTGGEANVRNLLTGLQKAREYLGSEECIPEEVSRIGYFPDAFGNASQMPQLMKQAHMDAIVFGRGVRPIGFNNEVVGETGEFDSVYSEMIWKSPDGSGLPSILFANWYNNGVEIPVDEERAKEYWDKRIHDTVRFASTDHLLLMNGCDHQPVQKDLSEALKTARKLYPDMEFVQSDLGNYVKEILNSEVSLSTVTGELISQETNGLMTLTHTASTHMDMKLKNRECENYLIKLAEPLSVQALLLGGQYPQNRIQYSWMKLLQNHPHDSICCCSVDEVLEQMKSRFALCRQAADSVVEEQLDYLAAQIGTGVKGDSELAFTVFSYDGNPKYEVVRTVLDWKRCWNPDLNAGWKEMNQLTLPEFVLTDETGKEIPADIKDYGVQFGYTLPDDRFRQPYMARQIQVTFEAELPGVGYQTYFMIEKQSESYESRKTLFTDALTLENRFIRVIVNENGTYNILNKENGYVFRGLGYFEDTGDIGNEYEYVETADHAAYDTNDLKPTVYKEEDSGFRAVIAMEYEWEIPESAAETLENERNQFVNLYLRKSGRGTKKTVIKVKNRLILEEHAKGLKVETTISNTAKDHRIRVCFPAGLVAESHYADSLFSVSQRKNQPGKNWINPSNCQRQQAFVAMEDGENGLLIANKGLYEYEITGEDRKTIAVTLLRCVGEVGDWGVFPTPTAQMQGEYTLEYKVLPYQTVKQSQAFLQGYQYQNPVVVQQLSTGSRRRFASEIRPEYDPKMKLSDNLITWNGNGIIMTGLKKSDQNNSIIIRWVNVQKSEEVLYIQKEDWMNECYFSNVIEEKLEVIKEDEGGYRILVKPNEIVTLSFVKGGEKC